MGYYYLWDNVRVQGGAYGSGFLARMNGDISCYSYRDPSPEKSVSIYSSIADALEKWCEGDERLENYIISTVAASEPLMSPHVAGAVQDEYIFAGVTFEERVAERREMLATTREGLLKLCENLRELGENGSICVVSNQENMRALPNLEIRSM